MTVPRPDALRVLVVDDNADAAEALAMLIRLWGHDAGTARDGPAALLAAALLRPDVALLDLGMPGMDGYELGRRLRALPGLGGVVLGAVTGYADESHRVRAAQAGFAFYLIKPSSLESLAALFGAMARDKGCSCATPETA